MFERVEPKALHENVFSMIGDQWMLVTAGTPEHLNTMTASWGGLGIMWGKQVAACFIRPQRYTREFVEQSDYFTLSFFGEEYRRQLALCGAKSGRELDKVKECGFTVETTQVGAPYFGEAGLVLACKKIYWQDMVPENVLDASILGHYEQRDYHRMYVGEIVEALRKG